MTKLIITCHTGEVVMIGDQVTITLFDIQDTQARVGITAPREVHIVRSELPELKNPNQSKQPRSAKGGKRSVSPPFLYRRRRRSD